MVRRVYAERSSVSCHDYDYFDHYYDIDHVIDHLDYADDFNNDYYKHDHYHIHYTRNDNHNNYASDHNNVDNIYNVDHINYKNYIDNNNICFFDQLDEYDHITQHYDDKINHYIDYSERMRNAWKLYSLRGSDSHRGRRCDNKMGRWNIPLRGPDRHHRLMG